MKLKYRESQSTRIQSFQKKSEERDLHLPISSIIYSLLDSFVYAIPSFFHLLDVSHLQSLSIDYIGYVLD